MIDKVAYARGVARALKLAGLLSTPINDDVSLASKDSTATKEGPAEQLAEILQKSQTSALDPQSPDNTTTDPARQKGYNAHDLLWDQPFSPNDGTSTYLNYADEGADKPLY